MRTFNAAALGAAAVLLPGAADGFASSATKFVSSAPGAGCRTTTWAARGKTSQAPRMMMSSYADRLREARAAKAAAAAGGQVSPVPPEAAPASAREPASAAAAAAPSGGPSTETLPQVADSPFSADLQEELRVAITILAARLQREKPMTRAEFGRFESAVAIIVEDALPLQDLPARGANPAAESGGAPSGAVPPRLSVVQSTVPPAVSGGDSSNTDDDFEVEGPQWDAQKVQYGLPTGVRNTYDIDDMEKMNPDEYQAALREKVINRAQSVRKTGSYGNIVSNEYLRFLGKNPKTGDDKFKKNEEFVKRKGKEDFGKY